MHGGIPHESTWVQQLREMFPALQRQHQGKPIVYLDGPAGTQVPQCVVDSVANAMLHHNANVGGHFATSCECTQLMADAGEAFADFLGVTDAAEIIFGANATTITLSISRAMAQTWQAGDEIIVTDLDHDSNVTPWVMAASERGVIVHRVPIRLADCTLDLSELRRYLNLCMRLVAVGGASNSVGTRNPITEIAEWVHAVGALLYVDAVHFAPHTLIDIPALACDFLVCSAYKFFGPHVGILWARRRWLESTAAYKVRPAPHHPPGKWMTGTQNHPCVAGAMAAVEYLADLGRRLPGTDTRPLSRRQALSAAFHWIEDYERRLVRQLLDGLAALPDYRVYGIVDAQRDGERMPTIALRHRQAPAAVVAKYLGEHGIFAWHGNYYALRLSEVLGNEPDGMLRLGVVHYNTPAEVDQTLRLLREFTHS